MKNKLDVAILVEDIEIAAGISNVLRATGVIPHFFESFKSFWYGTQENAPNLAIIDVKMMSAGELSLHDHPGVKSENINLIFYHNDSTAPLMFSTYDLWHLGIINGSYNVTGQLKSVLKRYNRKVELEHNNKLLHGQINALDDELKKAIEKKTERHINDSLREALTGMCNRIDESSLKSSLVDVCCDLFDNTDFISRYAVLELAPGNQRLVAPKVVSDKYFELSDLWIGKKCDFGIELFAQNLATQVAVESLDGEFVVLAIRGSNANPDKLFFVCSDDEMIFSNFDRDFLERHLSGVYGRFLLRKNVNVGTDKSIFNSYKMMDFIDGVFYEEHDQEYHLININFSKLVDVVRGRPEIRFYWGRFFEEFKNNMALQFDFNFRFASMNINNLGVLVSSQYEHAFDQIKKIAKSFPFWRYFENTDFTLGKDFTPSVKMVPMSSEAYLSFMENNNEFKYIKHTLVDRRQASDVVDESLLSPQKQHYERSLQL